MASGVGAVMGGMFAAQGRTGGNTHGIRYFATDYSDHCFKLPAIMAAYFTTYPALWLAQVQSWISLGFMAVFAALSLGLAWLLAWFRLQSLRQPTDAGWLAAYRFWVRVFALSLTLALAGGVVVLIQLPMLWPGVLERISAVASPLLTLAVIGAFLVKVCFLGPMLFAERRLSPAIHACAVLMVAVGVTLILACLLFLGAWMRTPAGGTWIDGQFVVHDWWQVLANPAAPWYAGQYLAASLLCAACLVLAITAWQRRTRPANPQEQLAFRSARILALASALTLLALVAGAANMTSLYQPAKVAATAVYPFAVQDTITLDEVVTQATAWSLFAIVVASVVAYVLLLAAFVAMVRHAARYGVIPIKRHRGRA